MSHSYDPRLHGQSLPVLQPQPQSSSLLGSDNAVVAQAPALDRAQVAAFLRTEAAALGLSHLAVVPASAVAQHTHYQAWLAADYAGEMTYLHRDCEQRKDPRLLLAEARSVCVVAVSYYHPDPVVDEGLRGQIARYARAEDYHLILKRRLGQLAEKVRAAFDLSLPYRVCVDSAAVLERALAASSGLGFQGKNTLLITPGVGSYTVLGELLLPIELPAGEPVQPRCGSCRLCLDVCPTGALIDDYQLDARRCISYLTIEYPGIIPPALRSLIGTWIVGCDLCQQVCPYNATQRPGDPEFLPHTNHALPDLLWLLQLGAAQFRRFVKRTAMRRLDRAQLLRNVAVALGNSATSSELPALCASYHRELPLVRCHLAWAIGQVALRDPVAHAPAQAFLAEAANTETDADVLVEIAAAQALVGFGECAS